MSLEQCQQEIRDYQSEFGEYPEGVSIYRTDTDEYSLLYKLEQEHYYPNAIFIA